MPRPGSPESTDVSLLAHFIHITDRRSTRGRLHPLMSILAIAVCAAICGADDWVAVAAWGKAKEDWLGGFLDLPNGIPSHDTFGRVFSIINPDEFQAAFLSWIRAMATAIDGDVVAIDGKTLRRSFDRLAGCAAIHMVSAWSTANGLVIGQVKTEEKSNEITAIPKLLQLLELKGCLVTIDAMGCQKKIAAAIIDKGGDHLLAVMDNQPRLFKDIKATFDVGLDTNIECFEHDYASTAEAGHGRTEERTAWVTNDLTGIRDREAWPSITSLAMVEAVRTVGDKTSVFHRFYISSGPGTNAALTLRAARSHWAIENKLHWCLDMAFREDESRIRVGHAAENMSRLRHIALNLLRQEKTAKVGIKTKRMRAGWDNDYLLRVLGVQ